MTGSRRQQRHPNLTFRKVRSTRDLRTVYWCKEHAHKDIADHVACNECHGRDLMLGLDREPELWDQAKSSLYAAFDVMKKVPLDELPRPPEKRVERHTDRSTAILDRQLTLQRQREEIEREDCDLEHAFGAPMPVPYWGPTIDDLATIQR